MFQKISNLVCLKIFMIARKSTSTIFFCAVKLFMLIFLITLMALTSLMA